MLTLLAVVIVALIIYALGPNTDWAPAKEIKDVVIDKVYKNKG